MGDHDAMSVDQLDGWAEVTCRCGHVSRGQDEDHARERHALHHKAPLGTVGLAAAREALNRGRQTKEDETG